MAAVQFLQVSIRIWGVKLLEQWWLSLTLPPCSDGCAEGCVLVHVVCATPELPKLPPGNNFIEPYLCVGRQTGL